jgi:hypothetical protein
MELPTWGPHAALIVNLIVLEIPEGFLSKMPKVQALWVKQ